ncbi:hypothetical protein GLOIN_2v1870151 [Rhizophagus clarus]|uniref:RNase H type-1 domain-containing protein n=1 Tax=Rhizophagus clarus TaxID=94130 RepID=A0A8H3LB58_9GLOM|nr:hypothetical protein GLOIN_2v1870151 [Rhizophagus clarus]
MLIKVKGHSEIKDNEEADKMAKNNTEKSICIKIKDVQQKDLTYDIYWDGIRIDRHIRKFMDNLCEATLDADLTVQHQQQTSGIKKQDIRKKPAVHQRIAYEWIPTLQIEEDVYDLEKRKILKYNEQWLIALEKARKHINQIIREENRKDMGEFIR